MKQKIGILLLLLSQIYIANACDNSSLTLVSQTTNPDGTISYTLDVFVELGSLDATFYGFVLQFNSSTIAPTVMMDSFPATIAPTAGLVSPLTGLIGSAVNSLANDSDWNVYDNLTNVLSYESGDIFGAASNDFSTTVTVTVSGCVESILLDASVNSGSPACEFSVSTGVSCTASCGTCVSPTCNIAGPYTDNATADLPANQCSQINLLSSSISGPANDTSYHSISTGADGTFGLIVSVGTTSGGTCTVNRTANLYPTSPCTSGSAIVSTGTGTSSFYNPEWTGLSPNTSYILEIIYTIPASCSLDDHCQSYYYPTPPPGCNASQTIIWD